jgi:ketosteroid isomerase-like protein
MSRGDVETARKAWDALMRRDLDAFLERVDPEVEFNSLVAEAEGGIYRGHDGVREWWNKMDDALGGLSYEVVEFADAGEGAVIVKLVASANVSDVNVEQTMWQALDIRAGRSIWWGVFRTEGEARAALAERA